MLVARVSGKWYALLLLAPCLILSVLLALEKFCRQSLLRMGFSWASCSVFRPGSWKRLGGWGSPSLHCRDNVLHFQPQSCSGCSGDSGTCLSSISSARQRPTVPTCCSTFSYSWQP